MIRSETSCASMAAGVAVSPKGCALWLFALAVLLAGCASHAPPSPPVDLTPRTLESIRGRHEPPPPVGLPQLSDGSAAKEPETGQPGADDRTRGPLTVDRAVEEALKASPELNQVRQRLAAAGEQVRQVESTFYPRLALAEEYNSTDNPVYALMNIINQRRFRTTIDFNNPGIQQNFSSGIRAEWSIFEGGSRMHDLKAAGWNRSSAEAELASARNQLVARVTETYYRWLQAISSVKVAERVLESAAMDEKLGEARAKVEMALPSEVLRLKARTAEMRSDLLSARTACRRLQAAMERLVVRPVAEEEVPEPTPVLQSLALAPPSTGSDSLVKLALERRPEMAGVRAMILAARERVESVKGGFLPKIGTNFRYEWDTEDFNHAPDSWLVGVQATWPIFEGGVTLSRLRESRLRLKEMEARGEQVALDISLEVIQAVLAVQEALEKVKVAEERKKLAESALHEVRRQYRDEVAGVDSLLQAEAAWSRAEMSLASALFEAQIAQAVLQRSLGDFAGAMEVRNE